MGGLSSFIRESRRRKVFRLAAIYIVGAWVVLQVADLAFESWNIPSEALRFVWFGMFAGFPIALVFGWMYDVTPAGIVRTPASDPSESANASLARADFALLAALTVITGTIVYGLIDRIQDIQTAGPPALLIRDVPEQSIAVLVFANLSQDESTESFTLGIHDDTLTQISRITSLRVISRTSVMQYRDSTKNLRTIARELGVATILEGGVQRDGDRVRINAQLIDARTDQHLWARTYDRQLSAGNIFAIQTEIATAIAVSLKAELTSADQKRLGTIPTENLHALEAYFLGRQALATRNSTELGKAAEHFRRAIEIDPGFALAYLGLADTLVLQVSISGLPKSEAFADAGRVIEQALQLDEQLAEAHTSLGGLRQRERDWDGARAALDRALELRPNYAEAHQLYGSMHLRMGHYDAALVNFEDALKLDPKSLLINNMIGFGLQAVGRSEEAIAKFRKVTEIDPEFAPAYARIGIIKWRASGQLDVAVRWYAKSMMRDSGNPVSYSDLGFLYLDLGDDVQAEVFIRRALDLARGEGEAAGANMTLQQYRGEEAQQVEIAQDILASHPRSAWALSVLRDIDLRAGRITAARDGYRQAFPALLADNEPVINQENYSVALDLAVVLQRLGEQDRAGFLIERGLQIARGSASTRPHMRAVIEARALALQGRSEQALAVLKKAADTGWRTAWWYILERDPAFQSIRATPEFQIITSDIRADMAQQLARVREMKAQGELAPLFQPES